MKRDRDALVGGVVTGGEALDGVAKARAEEGEDGGAEAKEGAGDEDGDKYVFRVEGLETGRSACCVGSIA